MSEAQEAQKQAGPTIEEAINHLRGYTNQRVIQHNATVQMLNNIICCLDALPASDERDFVRRDFERKMNEMVGDGTGRDAKVTNAMFKLMKQFPKPELKRVNAGEVVVGLELTEVKGDGGEQNASNEAQKEKGQEESKSEVVVPGEEAQEAKSDAAASDQLESDVQAENADDDEALEAEIDEIDEIVGDEAEVDEIEDEDKL